MSNTCKKKTKDEKTFEALRFNAAKYAKKFPCYDFTELFNEGWAGKIRLLEEDAPASHFYTSAKQTILDFIRKDIRQKRLLNVYTVLDEDHNEVNLIECLASNAKELEDGVSNKALLNYLMATAELTNVQKECLFMRFYKGMEFREIAKALNIQSHSTVWGIINKAIDLLKEIYDDTCGK